MAGIYSQINLLGNALNGTEQAHRVLSQNVANVNTPGYKTQRVEFDKLIEQLESAEAQGEITEDVPIMTVDGLAERVDGNNVDLEREVSELKKNALAAQSYAQLLTAKLATMRRAISG
jgi:flagellar basal-body rod protein FlgB